MFGAYEEMAKVLVKERTLAACCRSESREWCQLECRTGIRHG